MLWLRDKHVHCFQLTQGRVRHHQSWAGPKQSDITLLESAKGLF